MAGRRGRIELICGCMFSGKSERLLDRLAEARLPAGGAAVFKHASDDRYAQRQIVTHGGRRIDAMPIDSASRILQCAGGVRLVLIDEAQFFDFGLPEVCRRLADRGCDVVVAGLDRDSWGLPFGPIADIGAMADRVTHTRAVCSVCGEPADYTQRLAPIEGRSMIGGAEAYEPRCGRCFKAPPMELRR